MTKSSSKRTPGGVGVDRPVVRQPVVRQSGARLRSLAESWERMLRARNVAGKTLRNYTANLRYCLDYWERPDVDGPARVGEVTRAHCEGFFADCLARHLKPLTVALYHNPIKLFFDWCVEEEEIGVSPMALVKRPIIPDDNAAPPVLTLDEVRALFRTCAGKSFEDRRDLALLRLMLDTGLRHMEVHQLQVADVDLGEQMVTAHRKERRLQKLPFGNKTAAALDRYLRARDAHRHAASPALWVGLRGPVAYSAIYQIVTRRSEQAGLGHIWPHVMRHTFSSQWLDMEGQEGDLIELNGWSPTGARKMLYRYGRGARQRRARDAHKRLAPGDQY